MIHAHDGSEEGITTFTERGIESLKEFLADIRTWDGGVRQFLIYEQCDPEKIERIMADEPKSKCCGLHRMDTDRATTLAGD
jgi:hypothetical protein